MPMLSKVMQFIIPSAHPWVTGSLSIQKKPELSVKKLDNGLFPKIAAIKEAVDQLSFPDTGLSFFFFKQSRTIPNQPTQHYLFGYRCSTGSVQSFRKLSTWKLAAIFYFTDEDALNDIGDQLLEPNVIALQSRSGRYTGRWVIDYRSQNTEIQFQTDGTKAITAPEPEPVTEPTEDAEDHPGTTAVAVLPSTSPVTLSLPAIQSRSLPPSLMEMVAKLSKNELIYLDQAISLQLSSLQLYEQTAELLKIFQHHGYHGTIVEKTVMLMEDIQKARTVVQDVYEGVAQQQHFHYRYTSLLELAHKLC